MPQETKYVCTACGVSMTTGINLVSPPVHKCSKRANRLRELEAQNDIRDSKRRQGSSEEVC